MKILYVIDHLVGGGAEQQFVNIVNNVNAEKLVFLTEKGGIREKDLDGEIPVKGKYGKRKPLAAVFELKSLIETFNPDIVHSFLMYSCFISTLALKFSKVKPLFIAQEFSSPADILKEVSQPGLKKILLKYAYEKADAVVTISSSVARDIVEKGFVKDPSKVKYIYDGLDLKKYALINDKETMREGLSLLKDVLYVTFVGSLVKRKGADHLIRAFKEIRNEKARLLIIGEGPEKDALWAMANDDPRIEFLGYKENAPEYIRASDLFILPSLYEGLPNVIIEAMLLGTPVVATNVSGIPELIENDVNGFLVPPEDEGALKKALLELMENPALRNRFVLESHRKAPYFSIERMARDHEKLYAELLKT
jgi:glycosyltransferase involved in cell wall biosynthesis